MSSNSQYLTCHINIHEKKWLDNLYQIIIYLKLPDVMRGKDHTALHDVSTSWPSSGVCEVYRMHTSFIIVTEMIFLPVADILSLRQDAIC